MSNAFLHRGDDVAARAPWCHFQDLSVTKLGVNVRSYARVANEIEAKTKRTSRFIMEPEGSLTAMTLVSRKRSAHSSCARYRKSEEKIEC